MRDAVLEGLSDLRQRDLGLGLKRDILRHSRFRPPRRIVGPLLGQRETIRDGKARMTVRDRQRNGNLAIILLAELAAILPRHANRVLTLLRKACVINDKGFGRAVLFRVLAASTPEPCSKQPHRIRTPCPPNAKAIDAAPKLAPAL